MNASASLQNSSTATIAMKPQVHDERVAGCRLRCLHPQRVLAARGKPVELFNPEHLDQYRVVMLQKLYNEEDIAFAKSLKTRGVRVIFDMCDNHFYAPNDTPEMRDRADRLERMADIADVMTVSTPELSRYTPRPTVCVRDGLELPPPTKDSWHGLKSLWKNRRKRVELFWHGIAQSGPAGMPAGIVDIRTQAQTLEKLAREVPLRLTVMSNSREVYEEHVAPLPFPTRFIEWGSYARLCQQLPQHDICIIPITRNAFTDCKTHNRLTIALWLGVPVVADSIPAYDEFAPFSFLNNWEEGLRRYIAEPELRQQHVTAGKKYVEENYTVEQSADDWWKLFETLI